MIMTESEVRVKVVDDVHMQVIKEELQMKQLSSKMMISTHHVTRVDINASTQIFQHFIQVTCSSSSKKGICSIRLWLL